MKGRHNKLFFLSGATFNSVFYCIVINYLVINLIQNAVESHDYLCSEEILAHQKNSFTITV